MPEPLKHGPLAGRALHLCIDMQNLFAEATPWHLSWLPRILPFIERIARKFPEWNVFTRFISGKRRRAAGQVAALLPAVAGHASAPPRSQAYRLVPGLAAIAPFGVTFDKPVYSPFSNPDLLPHLRCRGTECLIVTGLETDVCVLSAVLGAVDAGFRLLLVKDAVGSSSVRLTTRCCSFMRRG